MFKDAKSLKSGKYNTKSLKSGKYNTKSWQFYLIKAKQATMSECIAK